MKIIMQAPEGQDSGGDIILRAGAKVDNATTQRAVGGSIIFQMADQTEVFRIDPDGQVLVRGNVVVDDVALYELFKWWLEHAVQSSGNE